MLLPICLAQTVLGRKLTTPDFMAGFHIFDADQDGFITQAELNGNMLIVLIRCSGFDQQFKHRSVGV